MDWIIPILAKLVNSDKIAGYVRGIAASAVTAFFLWIGAQVPFIAPFLTPELNMALVTLITGIAVGVWSQVAKTISAPTATEVVKVTNVLATKGVVDQPDADKINANPEIVTVPEARV